MMMATVRGRRHEGLRAVLSVVMVVTGMWLSGVVDRPASESSVDEAIGDADGVWTWVAESPSADVWSGEPVVSALELRCADTASALVAPRRDLVAPRRGHGRES